MSQLRPKRHGMSVQQCPCNAEEQCSKTRKGVVLCNCWTQCDAECPFGFDRIDETTEMCHYGDVRNLCTTNIVCDKALHRVVPGAILPNGKISNKKHSASSSSSEEKDPTKANVIHADTGEDDGYLQISIVGFVLWQIGSVGLGMMICGCAGDCVRALDGNE